MITPLSPLVKRKSFPQKVIRIVEKRMKNVLNSFINGILNITMLFKSFVLSVINRKYFWGLVVN